MLGLNNWAEYRLVQQSDVFNVSSRIDVLQQAGLKVDPATAALLLRNFQSSRAGDWLFLNAAISSVGRAVIQLARRAGVKTVNVVRRAELGSDLIALGANVMLVDNDKRESQVEEATWNSPASMETCYGRI